VKLKKTLNVQHVRELARRRLPSAVFDLIDGGAEDETTMPANAAAFADIEFSPRTLVDVSHRTLETSVNGLALGMPSGSPGQFLLSNGSAYRSDNGRRAT
jgi:isopentenyl diphosphate isomerase/L-lactate dehydrogenase-like FMN-dependent dehydrogenase